MRWEVGEVPRPAGHPGGAGFSEPPRPEPPPPAPRVYFPSKKKKKIRASAPNHPGFRLSFLARSEEDPPGSPLAPRRVPTLLVLNLSPRVAKILPPPASVSQPPPPPRAAAGSASSAPGSGWRPRGRRAPPAVAPARNPPCPRGLRGPGAGGGRRDGISPASGGASPVRQPERPPTLAMSTGSPLCEASIMGPSPFACRRKSFAPSMSFFCLARRAAAISCLRRPSRNASCCWAAEEEEGLSVPGESRGGGLPGARRAPALSPPPPPGCRQIGHGCGPVES